MPKFTENLTPDPLIAADPLIVRLIALYRADGLYRALRPKTLEFYRLTLHNFAWGLADGQHPQEPANFTPTLLKAFLVYVRETCGRWGTPRPNTRHPASVGLPLPDLPPHLVPHVYRIDTYLHPVCHLPPL